MEKRTTQSKRILIVDDHAGITNLWRVMLEKTGHYVVLEENSSRRALQTARAFRPDLLLLDIDMPGVDGPELARRVRCDEDIRDTPVVFLSSLISSHEAVAGKRVDGHPCLSKPTCLSDLVQTIEETMAVPC